MIPRPKFPESRTITYKGFTFFGFKPTKVGHLFLILAYLLSMFIAFVMMVESQDAESIGGIWFIFNVFVVGAAMLIRGLIWLIKNWNKAI